MIKDIVFPEVKNVHLALVPRTANLSGEWNVILINNDSEPITHVLVNSRGYGNLKGRVVDTATLRRYLGDVPANSTKLIEPMTHDLFAINNEFWVSFYRGRQIFDKKYIFTPGAVSTEFMTDIPLLEERGILHA
ncbi:MAG: hypothetical protein KDC37_03845 [Flavobacteriales bacterium]|jgi:hypothetical protein|nr:hypothetical protein [Flavobacteriales bacterium]